jgi:hypothetical protein
MVMIKIMMIIIIYIFALYSNFKQNYIENYTFLYYVFLKKITFKILLHNFLIISQT